jgi:hypothetical protein
VKRIARGLKLWLLPIQGGRQGRQSLPHRRECGRPSFSPYCPAFLSQGGTATIRYMHLYMHWCSVNFVTSNSWTRVAFRSLLFTFHITQCQPFPTFNDEFLETCHQYLNNETHYYLVSERRRTVEPFYLSIIKRISAIWPFYFLFGVHVVLPLSPFLPRPSSLMCASTVQYYPPSPPPRIPALLTSHVFLFCLQRTLYHRPIPSISIPSPTRWVNP